MFFFTYNSCYQVCWFHAMNAQIFTLLGCIQQSVIARNMDLCHVSLPLHSLLTQEKLIPGVIGYGRLSILTDEKDEVNTNTPPSPTTSLMLKGRGNFTHFSFLSAAL